MKQRSCLGDTNKSTPSLPPYTTSSSHPRLPPTHARHYKSKQCLTPTLMLSSSLSHLSTSLSPMHPPNPPAIDSHNSTHSHHQPIHPTPTSTSTHTSTYSHNPPIHSPIHTTHPCIHPHLHLPVYPSTHLPSSTPPTPGPSHSPASRWVVSASRSGQFIMPWCPSKLPYLVRNLAHKSRKPIRIPGKRTMTMTRRKRKSSGGRREVEEE